MLLFLIFLALPIIEIALFIQVGGAIGLWPTLAAVILTAVAGVMIIRSQGFQTLRRVEASLAEGHDPAGPIAHGALIFAAGILLLIPGFLTDVIGIALLLPPVRSLLIRRGASRMTVSVFGHVRTRSHPRTHHTDTVEADYEVLEDSPTEARRPPGNGSAWTRPPH